MKAIPQPKTARIFDRINALQATTSHYFNSAQLTPLVREWRATKTEIDSIMKVDACVAWEAAGAWKGLAGDVAGAETAFANSVRLGNSGSNRENWMINRLNLGLFSGAQSLYPATGHPETGYFTLLLEVGYKAGAIGQTASFIERAREMSIKWDENQVQEVMADRKSTRLNSSHQCLSRMPSSA